MPHRPETRVAFLLAVVAGIAVLGASCSGDSPQGPGADAPELRQIRLVGWTSSVAPAAPYSRRAGPDAVRLLGPMMMREVDEIYTVAQDDAYYFPPIFPGDFDGIVWFSKSTPSALRP